MRADILARRNAQAIARIEAALGEIVAATGQGRDALAAFQSAPHRDPAIAAMRRNEALADFIEGLEVTAPAIGASEGVFERLTAIPGIGPAKAKQIIAAIEGA